MSVAIVDDEPAARSLTRKVLVEYMPDLHIAGEAASVLEGKQLLSTTRPDLVLLDIEMGDGTGFDLLDCFDTPPPFRVVFVTGFDQFALRAFRCAAADYLLKPIEPNLLTDSIRRALATLPSAPLATAQLHQLQDLRHRRAPDRLLIPHLHGFEVVLLEHLLYLESDGNYTHFYQAGKPRITSSQPIAEYEKVLPEEQFMRVHQSFLLKLEAVTGFDTREGDTAIVVGGHRVPVSRRRKQEFVEALRGWAMGR